MTGYYVLLYPLSDFESGVYNKIQAQVKAFNAAGLETKILTCNCYARNYFSKIIKAFSPSSIVRTISNNFFSNDFYYFRYSGADIIPLLGLLKKIKQYKRNKVIFEIPTYPSLKEGQSGFSKIRRLINRIFIGQLKKYVDIITTFSVDDVIFGIRTIKIINGIDISKIPIIKKAISKVAPLNLIAVANYHKWHGYDRLLEGLKKYYEQRNILKIHLHFVGNGAELDFYKKLVSEYELSEYVIFYGILLGEELDNVYNKTDIAVSSLGSHRINIHLTSALKSKEYLARGIPMVSSTKIDVLPDGFKYCLYVPENDSPIDIQSVVQFYFDLLEKKDISYITHDIRRFAEKHCDMSITMMPVINYICQV